MTASSAGVLKAKKKKKKNPFDTNVFCAVNGCDDAKDIRNNAKSSSFIAMALLLKWDKKIRSSNSSWSKAEQFNRW